MLCKAYVSLWVCRAQAEDEASGLRGKPSCALTLMIRARDEDVRAQTRTEHGLSVREGAYAVA